MLQQSRTDFSEERMTSGVFHNDLKPILVKKTYFCGVLLHSKIDSGQEKMTSAMFDGDLKPISVKRK